jgi:hypothetical protein
MVIAKRDRDGDWHITDPPEFGCDWAPPEDRETPMETGTVDIIQNAVDGGLCDDCDW